MKILHITSHMGGGVGNALSSLAVYEKNNNPVDQHSFILLDEPINKKYINLCREESISITNVRDECLKDNISKSDVVILHWWNHPVMNKYLEVFKDVPTRLVLWSHVNGCNYPCLPYEFLKPIQKIFFTSHFSYENTLWTETQRCEIQKKSQIIYGLGDFSELLKSIVKKVDKKGKFNIGYVGTISQNKLHPDFVDYCYEVVKKINNAHFIMVGDPEGSLQILEDAKKYRIQDRFEFIGYVKNIAEELARFDVFAYPLNPNHYGTTENVMLEAMAFGIPIVALNHNSEKYILGSKKMTGMLADDAHSYSECIKKIKDDQKLRECISENAKEYVLSHFTLSKNVSKFRFALNEMMSSSKKCINFDISIGAKPYEWFMSFLGPERELFSKSISEKDFRELKLIELGIKNSSRILREENKSSIKHFSKVYPNDQYLLYWTELINEQS